ncbi:hypothetical protein [Mariniluteicoccus endophyticus]
MVAQQAVANMQLPAGGPRVGPPPDINPLGQALVGYPLWLWTDDPGQMSTTVTQQGLTLTLDAHRSPTRFTTSDGQSVRCGQMPRWSRSVAPMTKSPCGLSFAKVGRHTITAEATWQVTWTALGQTGTIPVTRTASATVPVTELQAVNTGGRS